MGFEMSVGGFFSFLFRPFTNPYGIVMLIGVGIWIFMRITGRAKVKGDSRGGRSGGGQAADYVIK